MSDVLKKVQRWWEIVPWTSDIPITSLNSKFKGHLIECYHLKLCHFHHFSQSDSYGCLNYSLDLPTKIRTWKCGYAANIHTRLWYFIRKTSYENDTLVMAGFEVLVWSNRRCEVIVITRVYNGYLCYKSTFWGSTNITRYYVTHMLPSI